MLHLSSSLYAKISYGAALVNAVGYLWHQLLGRKFQGG